MASKQYEYKCPYCGIDVYSDINTSDIEWVENVRYFHRKKYTVRIFFHKSCYRERAYETWKKENA